MSDCAFGGFLWKITYFFFKKMHKKKVDCLKQHKQLNILG